jgi:hypothetical protein
MKRSVLTLFCLGIAILLPASFTNAIGSSAPSTGEPAPSVPSNSGGGGDQGSTNETVGPKTGSEVPTQEMVPPAAGNVNINGTWKYFTSGQTVSGVCPNRKPGNGKIIIQQNGGNVTLQFVSGAVCQPASMCDYTGTITGRNIKVSNEATVDSEGGKVLNTILLSFPSDAEAEGSSTSRYVHPDGLSCKWNSEIALMRVSQGQTSDNSPRPVTNSQTDTVNQPEGDGTETSTNSKGPRQGMSDSGGTTNSGGSSGSNSSPGPNNTPGTGGSGGSSGGSGGTPSNN